MASKQRTSEAVAEALREAGFSSPSRKRLAPKDIGLVQGLAVCWRRSSPSERVGVLLHYLNGGLDLCLAECAILAMDHVLTLERASRSSGSTESRTN